MQAIGADSIIIKLNKQQPIDWVKGSYMKDKIKKLSIVPQNQKFQVLVWMRWQIQVMIFGIVHVCSIYFDVMTFAGWQLSDRLQLFYVTPHTCIH